MDLNLILFDFDGTLVNTTPLILRSFHATWRQSFGFVLDDAEYIKTFGMLLPTALRQLIEEAVAAERIGMPADVAAKAEELLLTYRAFNLQWHDEMIEPIEGVAETLVELKSRGFDLGVVSSKIRPGVERGLNLFEMAAFFDVVIGAEDVTHHKPHPEPLLRAIEKFDTTPERTIYVGDSIHDIAAGRAAGVKTAAAAWGPFPRVELERLRPDHLLDHPGELLQIFSR
jgi:pyrophosphatase PpaX